MSPGVPCCVCGAASGERTIGTRPFCERHFQKALTSRRSVWLSTALGLGGAVLFVLVAAAAQTVTPVWSTTGWSAWLLAALAGIPIVLWAGLFRGLDTLEPEPMGFTMSMILLGTLAQAGLVGPLLREGFRVGDWLTGSSSLATQWFGFILVVGLVQEAVKYACVRMTVFRHPEFDEPTDGIVYGAMAGLGFALAMNWTAFANLDQVDPWTAALTASLNAVSQATFGGLTGYFLGMTRFSHRPVWWMASGLLLAAGLNGSVQFLGRVLSRSGLDYRPEGSLILAVSMALGVFGILFALARQLRRKVEAGEGRS